MSGRSLLLRGVRLVPVGGAPAPPKPVDVRLARGAVQEVAPSLSADGDEVVDADGRWAIPGLWDQHVHMFQWAHARLRLDVSGTGSPDEVTDIVRRHVASLPEGDLDRFVQGYGYRSGAWARQPTVAELDAVSGGRPVVLASGDGHNGWLSSRALALLGLPAHTGALSENDWFPVFGRLADLPGAEDEGEAGYRTAVAEAAARGIVGIVDFEFAANYRDWPERLARGIGSLRVRAATYPDGLDEVLTSRLRTGQPLPGGGQLLTMGPLKVIFDGSVNTRTAYCCEPYADAAGSAFPRGRRNYSPDELVALVARARAGGLESSLHAIGDAAVATVLDAFQTTGARGSVEHAQMVRPADVLRMARAGVRASVQPAHLLDDRDVTYRCWPDRADWCFPFRSLRRAGVPLVMGSDAPVAPLDPWLAMAAAVHRSGDSREPWNPAESLTAEEVLAASTDGQPTIAAGSRGDVVLVDADPLAEHADAAGTARHLREMPVAATFLAGRPTHLAL